MKKTRLGLAICALVFTATGAQAQQAIDTYGSANWGSSWGTYSSGYYFGQTFSTPDATNTFLQSLDASWWVTGGDLSFQAAVSPWDASTGTLGGSALWSTTGTSGTTSADALRSFSPGVNLSPTNDYIFYLYTQGSAGQTLLANGGTSDAYSGGAFHYLNGSSNPSSTGWSSYESYGPRDLAFSAQFVSAEAPTGEVVLKDPTTGGDVSVPEPTSVLLLITGVLGMGATALLRRGNGASSLGS